MTDYSYRNDPAMPPFPDDKPVFVFDGECGFCSAWVQFALKRDRHRRYRFLAVQSEIGAALYRHYGLGERLYETSLFLENGRPYLRLNGIIRLLAGLGFPGRHATLSVLFHGYGQTRSMIISRVIAIELQGN